MAIGFYSFNTLCLLLFYFRPNLLIHELYTLPLVLISCFMALSILTSDFLEPSLSVISRSMLGISDRLSGMTLLALGNGISDITSTYQLMKTDTTSLALGELVGGMFFLITVIVGLMSLLRAISLVKDLPPTSSSSNQFETVTEDERSSEGLEYYRADFVHDIGTLVVTAVICLFALQNGKLDLSRSLSLFLAYFVLSGMVIIRQVIDGECPIFAPSSSEEVAMDDELRRVRTIEELNEVFDNIEEGAPTVTRPLSGIDPLAMDKYRTNLSKFEEDEFIRCEVIKQNIRNHLLRNRHGWMRLTLQDCLAIWENSSVFSTDKEPSVSDEAPNLLNSSNDNVAVGLGYGTIGHANDNNNNNGFQTEPTANKSTSSTAIHEFLPSDHASPEVVANESDTTGDYSLPTFRRLQKVVSLKLEETPSDLSPTDENLLYPVRTLIPSTTHTYAHQLEPAQSTITPETEGFPLNSVLSPMHSNITIGSHGGTPSRIKFLDQLSKLAILTLQAPTNFEFCTLVMTFPISLLLHLMMPSLDKCSLTEAGSVMEFSRCFPGDFQLYLSVILLWILVVGETFSNLKLSAAAVVVVLVFVVVYYYYLTRLRYQNFNNEDNSNNNRRYSSLMQRRHFTPILVFVLSLFVISKLVNIVVTILKSWTERFHISQSIMGITLFAWGNSIGDLVSNLAFSKSGVIDTALGACFGGPVLNLLFGIGFDGTLVLLLRHFGGGNDESQRGLATAIEFNIDSHLLCSSVGVAVAVFIYVVVVPINKWRIDRNIGMLLLADYFLVSMVNVYMEITN